MQDTAPPILSPANTEPDDFRVNVHVLQNIFIRGANLPILKTFLMRNYITVAADICKNWVRKYTPFSM
jgi:hypothetical protein